MSPDIQESSNAQFNIDGSEGFEAERLQQMRTHMYYQSQKQGPKNNNRNLDKLLKKVTNFEN